MLYNYIYNTKYTYILYNYILIFSEDLLITRLTLKASVLNPYIIIKCRYVNAGADIATTVLNMGP